MKSKTLKAEQEKWRNNKKKPIKAEQVKPFNSVVEVNLGNKLIKVQSKECIKEEEIIDQVKDLFTFGSYNKGDMIELSKVCDACFDLICTGLESIDNRIEINMLAC
jgi:hypothetical protein